MDAIYNNIYYVIIYVILILAIGFLFAYAIYRHYMNLVAVRDCFRSMAEGLEAISKDLKEMNMIIEGANREAEDINRKFEEKDRKDKDGK